MVVIVKTISKGGFIVGDHLLKIMTLLEFVSFFSANSLCAYILLMFFITFRALVQWEFGPFILCNDTFPTQFVEDSNRKYYLVSPPYCDNIPKLGLYEFPLSLCCYPISQQIVRNNSDLSFDFLVSLLYIMVCPPIVFTIHTILPFISDGMLYHS